MIRPRKTSGIREKSVSLVFRPHAASFSRIPGAFGSVLDWGILLSQHFPKGARGLIRRGCVEKGSMNYGVFALPKSMIPLTKSFSLPGQKSGRSGKAEIYGKLEKS